MTREDFVDRVVALLEQAPDHLGRELGEALVGMGVAVLEQLGVRREDVSRSILDIRNRKGGGIS